jgi:hypothetical protein
VETGGIKQMAIFNRNKKKQLEVEWQVAEMKEGESIFDMLDRIANSRIAEKAKRDPPRPNSDEEWLVAAALNGLSSKLTGAGLQAVRESRKVGLN